MIGDLISAGASLLGGHLSNRAARENTEAQIAAQREFAQHGVRWKVDDAKAAGVHPIYALGAQTHSFSPIASFSDGMGSAVADAGQHIGRAIDATRTKPERINHVMESLTLQRAELENDLLRSQIARLNNAQTGPAFPPAAGSPWALDGQGDSVGLVDPKPMEFTPWEPGRAFSEPGPVSDVGYARLPDGSLAVVPSKDAKERMEDMTIPQAMWSIRNLILPQMLGGSASKPPLSALPKGAVDWDWSPFKSAWVPKMRKEVIRPSREVFPRVPRRRSERR